MPRARSASGFQAGDVVERVQPGVARAAGATIAAGTLGTICRVVTPGRSYRIRYSDLDFCVLVFEESIRRAPAGSVGPVCEEDC